MDIGKILKKAKIVKVISKDTSVPGRRRNDNAGHNWERECRNMVIATGFPHVVTARSESRSRDSQKIDLMNTDEHLNGRLPLNIQCKNTCQTINYDEILTTGYKKIVTLKKNGQKKLVDVPPMVKVEGVINVIFHKFTSNEPFVSKKGLNVDGKFRTIGKYAILNLDDFLVLMAAKRELDELKKTR